MTSLMQTPFSELKDKLREKVVLVAGTSTSENQVTRKLRSEYGLKVLHTDQNKKDWLSEVNSSDAALIIQSAIDPKKADQIRVACRNRDIPSFTLYEGFSEVRSDFEKHFKPLSSSGKKILIQPPKKVVDPEPVEKKLTKSFSKRHSPDIQILVRNIVKQCYEAKMTMDETAEYLRVQGLQKPNGGFYKRADISILRWRLKKAKAIGNKEHLSLEDRVEILEKNLFEVKSLLLKALGVTKNGES